jgi:plastocyanin
LSRRMLSVLGLSAVLSLALAACGSSGSATAPAASAPASAPAASAAAACVESGTPGSVAVAIKGFAFSPSAITAKVGETVTFTNGDSASHTATLDDGTCDTGLITNGKSGSLTFSAAGAYPFHCTVHTDMKGTITVS